MNDECAILLMLSIIAVFCLGFYYLGKDTEMKAICRGIFKNYSDTHIPTCDNWRNRMEKEVIEEWKMGY